MMNVFDAPAQLINELRELHGKQLHVVGPLTPLVHRITSNYFCPYSSSNTGKNRAVQVYKCSQSYADEAEKKHPCSAKLEFQIVNDTIYLLTSDFRHLHPTDSGYLHLTSGKITMDECKFIQQCAIFGGSPGFIRGTLGIPIQPHKLFYERNKADSNQIIDEIQELEKCLRSWDGWKIEITKNPDSSQIMFIFFLHTRIIRYFFASQILIIDDTFCTNNFQLPIEAIVTPDYNQKNQLLAFAYIPDRCQASYEKFMQFLKYHIQVPYCFVSDRSFAQIGAIQTIFPTSLILYCRVHIKRNVESKFGISDVSKSFTDFLFNNADESAFLNFINERKSTFTEIQQRFLERLFQDFSHWAPSASDHILHCGNVTTNRIEGFFGKLKCSLDHKLHTLLFVSNSIKSLAETAILKLIKPKTKAFELPEFLMKRSELILLSPGAIKLIQIELTKITTFKLPPPLLPEECCSFKSTHGLPCCHQILNRMQLRTPWLEITDFNTRWILDPSQDYSPKVEILHNELNQNEKMKHPSSFIELTAKFEPYIDAAEKIPEIHDRLVTCLNDLSKFRFPSLVGNGQVKIIGRSPTHPAAKVQGPRKK
jgi:hypothetical protein